MVRAFAVILLVGVAAPLRGQRLPVEPVRASTIPLVGRWRLNLARTHYGNGVDVRRRETFSCDAESHRLRCVITSVRHDGRELIGRFAAALDGSRAVVTGIPDVEAVALRQLGSLLDATFFAHGQAVLGYRAYQSRDGASLFIVSVDPDSRAVLNTVVVYDRQGQ